MIAKHSMLLLSLLFVAPSVASAQWSAARGGPERTGIRPGIAQLAQPQAVWAMPLGGDLSSRSVWVLDSSDPAMLIAAGGRISAKAWDDVETWRTDLLQANEILAVIDVDQNGTDDTIIANRNGTAGTLTLLNMDGTVRWIAPPEMGPVINGVRIKDINNDGNLDLVVTPWRGGADPGVSAYQLAPISGEPTLLWHTTRDGRDYKAGFYDIVGEFDGSPGLELLSAGHRHLYLHDAVTGVLEQTSSTIGLVPYGRATMRAVDTNNDGIDEIFTFSNQGWAAPQNRRHVSSYSWNEGTFTERWSVSLDDPANDRLSFTDQSVGDFDNDGVIEVAFSIYDAQNSLWTIQVRDADTGVVLTSRPGARLSTIVTLENQVYLATRDDGLLEFFQFQRGQNLSRVYATTGLEAATCRDQVSSLSGAAPTNPGCTLPEKGAEQGGVLLFSRDQNEQITSVSVLHSLVPTVISTYTPSTGSIVGFWKIPNSGQATLAIGLSTGEIRPLTNTMTVPAPTLSPPYAWSGAFFGSSVERTNFARFPLSFIDTDDNAENLLIIRGDAEAVAISPSDSASMTAGVTELWAQHNADRISIADTGATPLALLFNGANGIEAVSADDGQQVWSSPNLFDKHDGLFLHHDPLQFSDKTWMHTADSNSGTYNLLSVSNVTGVVDSTTALDSNNSGWRRLTSVNDSQGGQTIVSGPISEIWTYDEQGIPVVQQDATAAGLIVDIQGAWLQIGRSSLQAVAYDGTVIWDTPLDNSPKTRLGTVVQTLGGERYITSVGNSNQIVALDTLSGSIVWSVLLSEGALAGTLTHADTVFGNVTGMAELSTTTGPAALVGGSDGYLYALDADNGSIAWIFDLGAPVGEVVTADWDGDGFLELCVVTEDGKVTGIDSFTSPTPQNVVDLDPQSVGTTDIDRLVSKNQLAAKWSPVDKAVGYEIAVFDMVGNTIQDFSPVGSDTSTVVTGLPLVSGTRYKVAVRARFEDSKLSVDLASDGVTVVFDNSEEEEEEEIEPIQPPATSGGCSTGTSTTAWYGLLILSLLFWRRRSAIHFPIFR